jgi:hypothetical protein
LGEAARNPTLDNAIGHVGFRVALPNLRVWLNLLGFVVFELAIFEFDDAIGDMEIMIIMTNHEYGFAVRS